ncbi:MAG: anaerobic ribonucleoside-triphosphate reductase activating protein [Rickettsiales bacterium]|jgi:pyruvate formate lyase activating enzyme|nr:anaerobic ribonucleoside-triphosphate reductase activating protein [Rickettsiales bacterium]
MRENGGINSPIAGGMTPFTTIDYPGKVAAVVFLCGCNLRCKHCSNPQILETDETDIKRAGDNWRRVTDFLTRRAGKLDAVVFSGGEATLQAESLAAAIPEIKKMNYKIGLHTNGTLPDKLALLLPHIDWVGMDIKTDRDNYAALTGIDAWEKVMESLSLLLARGGEFEIRTTLDSRFISKKSLEELAKLLSAKGVKNYAVQKVNTVGLAEKDAPAGFSELFDKDAMRALFPNFIIRD